jgi:aspartyl-tRNA(Asn)/glutamyl-tRNA(Gln) amidotransferase subunit C
MISKEEVQKIAELARLELSGKEAEKMQKDLSAILDYFDLLKKAPPLRQGFAGQAPESNNLRKDEVLPEKREMAEKIIQSAPDKKDDYIKVKAVL